MDRQVILSASGRYQTVLQEIAQIPEGLRPNGSIMADDGDNVVLYGPDAQYELHVKTGRCYHRTVEPVIPEMQYQVVYGCHERPTFCTVNYKVWLEYFTRAQKDGWVLKQTVVRPVHQPVTIAYMVRTHVTRPDDWQRRTYTIVRIEDAPDDAYLQQLPGERVVAAWAPAPENCEVCGGTLRADRQYCPFCGLQAYENHEPHIAALPSPADLPV